MNKEIKAIMQAFKNQFTIIDQIENAKESELRMMEKQYVLQFGIVKSDLALFRILPDSKEEHLLFSVFFSDYLWAETIGNSRDSSPPLSPSSWRN